MSSAILNHPERLFPTDPAVRRVAADLYFDHINDCLGRPEFQPRALLDRFNIEVLATTESPLDSLGHHQGNCLRSGQESLWFMNPVSTNHPLIY